MKRILKTFMALLAAVVLTAGTVSASEVPEGSIEDTAAWEAAEEGSGDIEEEPGPEESGDAQYEEGDIEEPLYQDAEEAVDTDGTGGAEDLPEEDADGEDIGDLSAAGTADKEALRKYILDHTYKLDRYIDLTGFNASYEDVKSIDREAANREPALMYFTYHIDYKTRYVDGNAVRTVTGLSNEHLTDEVRSLIYAYRKKCDQIVAGMDRSWSDFEKILYIHDWLCTNNTCISHVNPLCRGRLRGARRPHGACL